MTLPTLVGNYQKNVTVTKLQKAYSTINQALKMSEVDNEAMKYWEEPDGNADKSLQIFEKYFKPYLKIGKKCDNSSVCPFKNSDYCRQDGRGCVSYTGNSIQSYMLNDGTYIKFFQELSLIKSFDGSDSNGHPTYTYGTIKNTVVIDLNGFKGPALYGKDVFLFYYESGILKPYVELPFEIFSRDYSNYYCNSSGDVNGLTGTSCASKIIRDGWKIKKDYPW